MHNSKPILLVEDDQVDAMIVERALKSLKVANKLVHKLDGKEALDYLRNGGSQEPYIVLLDLNMPRMNGFEFLRAVKADAALKTIPIVVLTTSHEEGDIVQSFNLGAAGYIVKSVDYTKFVEAIRIVNMYWTLSELPCGE